MQKNIKDRKGEGSEENAIKLKLFSTLLETYYIWRVRNLPNIDFQSRYGGFK